MARRKNIKTNDFRAVFAEDWEPVVLEGEAMPEFARAILEAKRCCIIASGQDLATQSYSSRLVPSGRLVGGIDIYRHDPRDREPLNKDWYAVVATGDPDELAVDGPYRDEEHWLREVPSRYEGAKIIGGGEGDDGE